MKTCPRKDGRVGVIGIIGREPVCRWSETGFAIMIRLFKGTKTGLLGWRKIRRDLGPNWGAWGPKKNRKTL